MRETARETQKIENEREWTNACECCAQGRFSPVNVPNFFIGGLFGAKKGPKSLSNAWVLPRSSLSKPQNSSFPRRRESHFSADQSFTKLGFPPARE
jgi:hypothetical protein